jgi:hypothetical protein
MRGLESRMTSKQHLTDEYILAIAESDPLILTEQDFSHLQDCRQCFLKWKRYTTKAVTEERHEKRLGREPQYRLDEHSSPADSAPWSSSELLRIYDLRRLEHPLKLSHDDVGKRNCCGASCCTDECCCPAPCCERNAEQPVSC